MGYAKNDLSNYKNSKEKKPIQWMEVVPSKKNTGMQETLDAVRKGGYKGANWLRK